MPSRASLRSQFSPRNSRNKSANSSGAGYGHLIGPTSSPMSAEVQSHSHQPFSPLASSSSIGLPPLTSPLYPPHVAKEYGSHTTSKAQSTTLRAAPISGLHPLDPPLAPDPRSGRSMPHRCVETTVALSPYIFSGQSSPSSTDSHGVKRPYEETSMSKERPSQPNPLRLAPPIYEYGDPFSRVNTIPPGDQGPLSPTPSGTTSSFPVFGPETSHSRRHSQSSMSSNSSRCTLHIRQQPRAARAGPDGRDRRALDPPPIVQLLINDFDPDSPADSSELRNQFFIVHCSLFNARDNKDVSTQPRITEDGRTELQRLLLGTTVSSPFFCQEDPDPENAIPHPTTIPELSGPPSPSARFIAPSTAKMEKKKQADPGKWPATFFIFADLSVRRAGEYRLGFMLMKMDSAAVTNTGSTVPIIHSTISQVFRVVNAKDFDQVHPSTNLVKGLLERGAGFPLKLKKGIREGQRRRRSRDASQAGDGEEEEEEEEEEDGDED